MILKGICNESKQNVDKQPVLRGRLILQCKLACFLKTFFSFYWFPDELAHTLLDSVFFWDLLSVFSMKGVLIIEDFFFF